MTIMITIYTEIKEKKNEKPRLVSYSQEWEEAVNRIARSFAPMIYSCKKCDHPVVRGYCCTGCGDPDPSSAED